MNRSFYIVLTGITGLVANASATLITFDDGQPNGTAVGSFYSGLGITFTDTKWNGVSGQAGASGTQGIRSLSSGGQPQQSAPLGASFSFLVSTVTLRGLDIGEQGFRLKAFDDSNTLVDNQVVLGTGIGQGQFFDLTVTGLIKRVEFSQDNAGTGIDGLFFDNLSFTAAPVPEPATVAALGLGVIAFLKKRRNRS